MFVVLAVTWWFVRDRADDVRCLRADGTEYRADDACAPGDTREIEG